MTPERFKKIINDLSNIASTPHSTFGGINFVSFNKDKFQHKWIINPNPGFPSDYKINVESINEAVDIIHEFSDEPKEVILEGLKSLSTYIKDEPIDLHYVKEPKDGLIP